MTTRSFWEDRRRYHRECERAPVKQINFAVAEVGMTMLVS